MPAAVQNQNVLLGVAVKILLYPAEDLFTSNKQRTIWTKWKASNIRITYLVELCEFGLNYPAPTGEDAPQNAALKQLHPISSNYEIESETIIEAHHKGFKIKFIPIKTIYSKQISRINPIIDTIRFFRFMLMMFCPFLFNKK